MTQPIPPTVLDKATLAAFADGELPPEQAAAVVLHLADHPGDQAYVDDIVAANAALARAFSAPMDEPVPDRFRTLILGAEAAPTARVLPFPRRVLASARAGWSVAGLSAAAALTAVALLWPSAPAPTGAILAAGPVAPDSALALALQTARSGEARDLGAGRGLTITASLPVPDGFCREVELSDAGAGSLTQGLACTRGQGWSVVVALSAAQTAGDAQAVYAPASGDAVPDLSPYLDQVQAGAVLDPAAEADLIARGWR
jgi:hypothetical protein